MKSFEQTASDVASRATYGGALTGVLSQLADIDWAMWIGVTTAVIGLLVNIYYKSKEYQLNKLKINAEIERLNKEKECDCGKQN